MEKLEDYYKQKFLEHGHNEAALGWSKGKQFVRFRSLVRNFNLTQKSILDIGCGFGDFVKFAAKYGLGYSSYHGIDLMQEFVDIAITQHGKDPRNIFEVKNLLDLKNCQFDFAFASGIFGRMPQISDDENYRQIERTIEASLGLVRESVAFDFLSDKVEFRSSPKDFHANPARILELAYKFSKNVILDNSVMPFEFVLVINKDQSFKKETTVFNRFLDGNIDLVTNTSV